ncbi:hypothetical protein D3C85_1178260 [compost metagenome]
MPIGSIECRQVTVDARFNFFHSPLQFGAGEIAVAIVDCFEFTAINGDQMFSKQSQLLTQHNELATDASDGLAVVFSEVGDGLEIRHQTPGQPHQFDVALSFSLQPSARLNAVEIAVDVDLQQDRGVVSRPASIGWNGTFKTQIDQVEFVDKDVDYAHRIGIADVVVEALGK